MNYILEPMNENHEMACMVKFSGNRSDAVKKATGIAATLQAQLDGASITCRVRKAAACKSHYTEEAGGLIVTPAGQVLDEATGNPVKL
jgi:hypothetical protein